MENNTDKLQKCLQKFIDHVSELENEEDPSGNGFHREYRVLRDLAFRNKDEETFPATFGKLSCNVKKNRYRDIVPYDSHRVTLDEIPNVEGSDYINASFIEGALGRAAYIASQGPLPHTLNDFWRMLWNYKVKVVIMACKEVEMGKKKCACYWPENTSETATFNDIKVKLVSETNLDNADDCVERCMEVYKGNEGPLQITQFQYTGWPDHGIPDDVDVILEMILKMRFLRLRDRDFAPVVIHCSAGCGRTGTICAIDYAWEMLKSGRLEENFNLYEIIKRMREQRQSMIQTPEQYMMAHIAIRDLFLKHIDVIEGNIYANVDDKDGSYNDNVEDSSYSDVNIDETYSYVEPKQLLEREVMSIVSIYSDAASLEPSSSKPPLSPKPQTDMSKKQLPEIDSSPPSLPAKQQKEQSPKPAKRTSKNVLSDRKEEDQLQGKSSEKPTNQGGNYSNMFTDGRYINVDPPVQEPKSLPPPKPPLTRVPSDKKKLLPTAPTGPTFVKTSPGPTRKNAIHANKPNNTQAETSGKYVTKIDCKPQGETTTFVSGGGAQGSSTSSSGGVPLSSTSSSGGALGSSTTSSGGAGRGSDITLSGDAGQRTSTTSSGGAGQRTSTTSSGGAGQTSNIPSVGDKNRISPDMPNKKIPENVYSLASSVKADETNKLENKGPMFKQSRTGGDIYAQVNKSSGHSDPSSNMAEYSEVNKQTKLVNPGLQNKGRDPVYETIGTNGDFRPKLSSPKGGIYEDIPVLNPASDSLYSLADPVSPDSEAPTIPERGYRENETDDKDYSQTKMTITDNTSTLGRLKQKYFKGSSDTNVDTSDIPGFKKRLGKTPKGKREKPTFWEKIRL